jgi:hypothetical protein
MKLLSVSVILSQTTLRESTINKYIQEATLDCTICLQARNTILTISDQVIYYLCRQKGYYTPDCSQKETVITEIEQLTEQFTDSETDLKKEL